MTAFKRTAAVAAMILILLGLFWFASEVGGYFVWFLFYFHTYQVS
ncbi:hypothetical protein [Alicyclobacillus acidiphilus]|nr:hypothetical protein [Alicyclobacillus acidiphilus]